MRVFYVTEFGVPPTGTPIVQGRGEAYIPTPVGGLPLLLDQEIVRVCDENPPPEGQEWRLGEVGTVLHTASGIRLTKTTREPSNICLVHLCLRSPGGRIVLTANTFERKLLGKKVERDFNLFPDGGIEPFATDDYLEAINRNTQPEARPDDLLDEIELFMLMHPDASFRVHRTGYLGGKSPELFIHWRNSHRTRKLELEVDVPARWRPRPEQSAETSPS